jgi:PAS domain S-box-containing protein
VPGRTLGRIITWLVTPAYSSASDEERAASRLLLSFAFLIVSIAAVFTVYYNIVGYRFVSYAWQPGIDTLWVILASALGYLTARYVRVQIAAAFIIGLVILTVVWLATPRASASPYTNYYIFFLILPVIYASLFYSTRATALTAVACMIAALPVYYLFVPTNIHGFVVFVGYLTVGSGALIMGTHYRTYVEKQRRRVLEANELRMRLITETMTETLMVVDPEYRIVLLSTQPREREQFALDRLVGESVFSPAVRAMHHPEDDERVCETFRSAFESGRPVTFEYRANGVPGGPVEWIETTVSFLRDSYGVLQNYILVARRITDRKRAEAERQENARLIADLAKEHELNATRNRLMRGMSHEFRTPLAVLKMAADILHLYNDRLSPDEREAKFAQINQSVRHMTDMFDDVMSMVRLQGSGMPILEQVDLARYGEDFLARWRLLDARHTYVLRTTGDLANLSLPLVWLEPILHNLLDNAAKYAADGTPIVLHIERGGGTFTFTLTDAGPGIALDDVPHVFEPFTRGRGVQNISGSGLGLTIVKACAERWGGRVELTTGPAGTSIRVRVPEMVRENVLFNSAAFVSADVPPEEGVLLNNPATNGRPTSRPAPVVMQEAEAADVRALTG